MDIEDNTDNKAETCNANKQFKTDNTDGEVETYESDMEIAINNNDKRL